MAADDLVLVKTTYAGAVSNQSFSYSIKLSRTIAVWNRFSVARIRLWRSWVRFAVICVPCVGGIPEFPPMALYIQHSPSPSATH
jgi:hypothetical protein